jgi:hypothetical protein
VFNHINTETIKNFKSKAKSPPWKQRLEHKIKKLTSELNQLCNRLHTKIKPSYALTPKYEMDKRGQPYAKQRLVAHKNSADTTLEFNNTEYTICSKLNQAESTVSSATTANTRQASN